MNAATLNRQAFEHEGPRWWPTIQCWWSEITEADLTRVAGRFDHLLHLLHVKYGYSLQGGEEEFNRRMSIQRAWQAKRIATEFKLRLAKYPAK